MQEEWRDVIGFEGIYQVSNYGRVKRIGRKSGAVADRILKQALNIHSGYLQVGLWKNHKKSTKSIHRFVALTFIPNPENKPEIDHIDGNRLNNRVDNLQWVTKSENMLNPITRGRSSKSHKINPLWRGKYGKYHNRTIPIVCIELDRLFFGTKEAGRELNINSDCICKVLKGKIKTAGGYHWRYATNDEILAARCGAVCTV